MDEEFIQDLKEKIIELSEVIAAAALKNQCPPKDELTTRQVILKYKSWGRIQIQKKRVKGHRKGPYKNSPVVYSDLEFKALMEAEKKGARIIVRNKKP